MLRSPIPAGVDRYRQRMAWRHRSCGSALSHAATLIGATGLAAGAVPLARQQITASRCGPDGVCTPPAVRIVTLVGCSSASFCSISAIAMFDPVIELRSTLTCPHCGHQATETMPTNACQFFYDCIGCGTVLSPGPATVASSALMEPCRVRRSRSTARTACCG
jgi:hypothetical protein